MPNIKLLESVLYENGALDDIVRLHSSFFSSIYEWQAHANLLSSKTIEVYLREHYTTEEVADASKLKFLQTDHVLEAFAKCHSLGVQLFSSLRSSASPTIDANCASGFIMKCCSEIFSLQHFMIDPLAQSESIVSLSRTPPLGSNVNITAQEACDGRGDSNFLANVDTQQPQVAQLSLLQVRRQYYLSHVAIRKQICQLLVVP